MNDYSFIRLLNEWWTHESQTCLIFDCLYFTNEILWPYMVINDYKYYEKQLISKLQVSDFSIKEPVVTILKSPQKSKHIIKNNNEYSAH